MASVPFQGRPGYEGIAIGTDFLELDELFAGIKNVEGLSSWLSKTFDREIATLLIQTNGRRLLTVAAGGEW